MGIPVLDLAEALHSGDARSATVAEELRQAAMATGFFYVRNHGIAQEMIQRQFHLAAQMLELPVSVRDALSMRNSPALHGFERMGAQTLDAQSKPDLNESFYCGMAYADDHPYVLAGYPTYGHNQWPSQVPQAAGQCEDYIRSLLVLARRLMQLLALSLNLAENYFDESCRDPMITLRMLRYPPHPRDADEKTFGAGAHTDWGAITILAQDMHGGLEVALPDGTWLAAEPMEGAFVVNLGDMIPRWTNGLYHSNLHRVRNTKSRGDPRFSIPFFYEPDYLAVIKAVPGTYEPGEEPLYPPCTAGEHLKAMYRRTYESAVAKRDGAVEFFRDPMLNSVEA